MYLSGGFITCNRSNNTKILGCQLQLPTKEIMISNENIFFFVRVIPLVIHDHMFLQHVFAQSS